MIMAPGSPFSYHKAVVDACLPFFVVIFLMSAAVLFLLKFWKFLISKNNKDYFVMTHDFSVLRKLNFFAL
jgi:hypothetical protein